MSTKSNHGQRQMTIANVPERMKAAAIDGFGKPEALKVHELRVPELGEREVLIALHTVGVGSWDAEIRGGWYPAGTPVFPLILGTDGSGHIAAVGPGANRFEINQPVYAYSFLNAKGGFYAQYVVLDIEKLAPIPKGLSMREAGAIPTTALTALQGIDDALQVESGQALAIVGASGAVGTLAIQFAKLRGARVLAVASGEDGQHLARQLGADLAIDRHSGNLSTTLRQFAPNGLDAVLALAGGETLDEVISGLKDSGRAAYPNGVEPAPRKRPNISVIPYDAVPGMRQFEQLGKAIEAAELKVSIQAAFPLADAARSHQRIEEGHVLGKIVLEIV